MAATKLRLASLDYLRGLTVAAMILVNNPGSWSYIYPPLRHAEWNGCTFTDLVFPFFLQMVGVSIYFAYSNMVQMGLPFPWGKILSRTAWLLGLGLTLNFIPSFDFIHLRWPGVLQRIGIVFLVSVGLFFGLKRLQWIIGVGIGILIFYFISMVFMGENAGALSPGINTAASIDRFFLDGHLWEQTKTWDPEGLWSTLPAIASCIIGICLGYLLKKTIPEMNKFWQLLGIGGMLMLMGGVWDVYFPINKSLWTSSFVCWTGGCFALVMATVYLLIDLWKFNLGAGFFVPFGSNAIVAYVLSEFLAKWYALIPLGDSTISEKVFLMVSNVLPSNESASLALALAWVGMIFIPIRIMYNRKVFIKV